MVERVPMYGDQPQEWKRVPLYGESPICTPGFPTADKALADATADGWRFVALLPGVDHAIAERQQPAVLILTRDRPPMVEYIHELPSQRGPRP